MGHDQGGRLKDYFSAQVFYGRLGKCNEMKQIPSYTVISSIMGTEKCLIELKKIMTGCGE
jgi:hypothetical protein